MNFQDASNLRILEGDVRTIHDKDSRLLWGSVGYNVTFDGNATQTTYSGKNLLENKNHTRTYLGITFTKHDDGSFTVNGKSTGNAQFYLTIDGVGYQQRSLELPAGTYTINGRDSGGVKFECNYEVEGVSGSRYATGTFAATAPIKCGIYVTVTNGTTVNNLTIYPQLEAGSTATSYEPYVGGIPAPNPEFPMPISVVTGENVVKVVGKNLLNSTIEQGSLSSADGLPSSSPTRVRTASYIPGKASTTYAINAMTNNEQAQVIAFFYKADNTFLGRSATSFVTTPHTFTTPAETAKLKFAFTNRTSTNITPSELVDIQLELGNQATSYESYTAQDYEVNLGSTELAKIGTYHDQIKKNPTTGKWYAEKQVGKITFDGSEPNWQSYVLETSGFTQYYRNLSGMAHSTSEIRTMSDYFAGGVLDSRYRTPNLVYTYASGVAFNPYTSDFANTTAFTTWLSTHPTTVYYVLATPTTAEITDATLIAQLEAVYDWVRRHGYNASVTGDLPIIINRTALS